MRKQVKSSDLYQKKNKRQLPRGEHSKRTPNPTTIKTLIKPERSGGRRTKKRCRHLKPALPPGRWARSDWRRRRPACAWGSRSRGRAGCSRRPPPCPGSVWACAASWTPRTGPCSRCKRSRRGSAAGTGSAGRACRCRRCPRCWCTSAWALRWGRPRPAGSPRASRGRLGPEPRLAGLWLIPTEEHNGNLWEKECSKSLLIKHHTYTNKDIMTSICHCCTDVAVNAGYWCGRNSVCIL